MDQNKNNFFALGLTEHRIWGFLFIPMIIKKNEGELFYSPAQTVLQSETDSAYLKLSHTEKELVKIAGEYSDHNLFKYFSKFRNIKEFQEKVSKENIENFIRPYIEKRLLRMIEIVTGTKIKVFFREKTRLNIFDEDFLLVNEHETYPNFYFERMPEGSRYSLVLKNNDVAQRLKDQYIDIICLNPAIIRINRNIHTVHQIDAKKIIPFTTKDYVSIPGKTEKQYFKSFVINIVRDHEVNAKGFSIDITKPEQNVLLSLERGLRNNAVFVLRFQYGKRVIMANSEQKVFVDFFDRNNDFRYEKYFRDISFETEVHDQLNSLSLHSFDMVNFELKMNRDLDFQSQVYNLIEWLNRNYDELMESGFSISQKSGEKSFHQGSYSLKIRSELHNDWFDIYAILKIGEFEIPFLNLRKHILEENREYILPDKSIFVIPSEWFARFREMFEFCKKKDDTIQLHKQHFIILEKAEKGIKNSDFKSLEPLVKKEKLPSVKIPEKLAATLRPYQLEGFTWLMYLQQQNLGGCLADDMGLGKTLQAITLILNNTANKPSSKTETKSDHSQLLLFANEEHDKNTNLVVVPASLVHNWINELKKFAPNLKCLAYIGPQRQKSLSQFSKYDVIISSYHTIRQDIETISSFRFHYIILDESQVIKNPSSQVYKSVQLLNSEYRLVLTGTPIENSLIDLWAQMNFINNGLLGSLNYFRREFVIPIERKKDAKAEDKLKNLINPFILRRKKEEVAADLPEMTEQIIYCSMTEEQRKFYEEEKSSIRNAVFSNIEDQGIERSAIIVLQGLTRLRQISNHPKLVDEDYKDGSGKYEEILRNLQNLISEGHKVLVFSSFVKHLDLIKARLEEEKVRYTMLTGASTKREDLIKIFQEQPDCKIFLISLKAGGIGLNLTAADYVFILDPWWNPASEDQAVNRAHRIGQDKNVFVYRFISENSIEEKIQVLQERKTQLAENFVRSNNPLKDVKKEELEALFE